MKTLGGRLRLLLVDDSAVIRERLARALSTLDGVEVIGVAEEVDGAVKDIEALDPDLIVLDANLGRSDGIAVLQYVNRHRPATLVMVFSNDDSSATRERYLAEGAFGYFDKSLEYEALCAAIRARASGSS